MASDDSDKKLADEYLSHNPTVDNSRDIVKKLAASHSITEAKVRTSLVRSKVYVSQPRRAAVATPQQAQAVKAFLSSIPDGDYVNEFDIGAKFNLTLAAVMAVKKEWQLEKWAVERAEKEYEYEKSNKPSVISELFSMLNESGKATGSCMVTLVQIGFFLLLIWAIIAVGISVLQVAGR
ncbi:hypothetical protein [Sphingobium sp. DN12]|uniref:hypothetical protein n=1 Tax=Sphingobium sp. DN12 TaxID=3378073 RepID=UPI003DA2178F